MGDRDEKMISQRKMAGYLLINGCILCNVTQDRKIPNRDVYFFKEDEKLHHTMSKYSDIKDILYKLEV